MMDYLGELGLTSPDIKRGLITYDEYYKKITKEEIPQSLEEPIKEYKAGPRTPELVGKTWAAVWKEWGERAGLSIAVPAPNWSLAELDEIDKNCYAIIYKPSEVSLSHFGRIFPRLKQHKFFNPGSPVSNDPNVSGWVTVEKTLEAPNLNHSVEELRELYTSQGRSGMTLDAYVIRSQFSYLMNGRYLDEYQKDGSVKYWCHLPGSTYPQNGKQRAVCAYYLPDGWVGIADNIPKHPTIGGRSMGLQLPKN